MIFLNIVQKSPAKIHSNELLRDAQKLIAQTVSDLNREDINIEDFAQSMIDPLFNLYMNHNEEIFNALSKALVLDYCQNFSPLKRDADQSYRSVLKRHCKVWQDSQAAVYELVASGKASLLHYNQQADYQTFHTNATEKMTSLEPVLAMVNAYLLSDIYAFLPILDEEGFIKIKPRDWQQLGTEYNQALERFVHFAKEAHFLNITNYEEAQAI
tara:strand:+ start:2015 stop:2653 length:639 start_codon:yes stop_codon:yes gene_type:complete